MLLRQEPDGRVLAFTQPAHAALAGRLAEAWDDELSPTFVQATHHHDDVWAQRDAAPPWSAASGLPETFLELVPTDRVAVWSRAPELAAPLGPEGELWVLRHAERLHVANDAAVLKAMTAAFSLRIDVLVAELRSARPGRFDDLELARGTSLLALLDTLALRLCFGVEEPGPAGVLALSPAAGDAVAVAPWPFTGRRVETTVEARRLPGPTSDPAAQLAAWAAAEPFALPVTLVAAT